MLDWIDKLKVAELKEELKKRGLPVSGKKAELAKRLNDHVADSETGAQAEEAPQGGEIAVSNKEETTEPPEDKGPPVEETTKDGKEGIDAEKKTDIPLSPPVEGEKKRAREEDDAKSQDAKQARISVEETAAKDGQGASDADIEPKGESLEEPKEEEDSDELKSRALLVQGFERPFTLLAARELMEKHGTVISMWMPTIKDKAYVVFSTVSEAQNAKKQLYKLKWPSSSSKVLEAEYTSVSQAEKAIGEGGGNPDFKIERTPEDPKEAVENKKKDLREDLEERRLSVDKKEHMKSLMTPGRAAHAFGNEFKSTTAAPMIYWTTSKPLESH